MSVADVALSPIRHSPAGGCNASRTGVKSESIVIYLSVAGSLMPIRVLETDSIESVKLRIQTCKGFVVKKQKLVYGGRELARNDSLVRDYGVKGGKVLHLVLKLSDLLLITVKTCCGKELEFQVDRYQNVAYLKQRIAKKGKHFYVDVEDQDLFCLGEKLEDQRVIADICKNGDAVIHLFVQKSAKVRAKPVEKDLELSVVARDFDNEYTLKEEENQEDRASDFQCPKEPTLRDFWLEPVVVNPKVKLSDFVLDMINATFDGLEKGHKPVRSCEGTGGTYFMKDPSGAKFISVFKPMDEEPMAVNNPRGLPESPNGEGLKRGTRVGEGALREVAAYILDHPKNGHRSLNGEVMGFAGVPPTAMVRCLHEGFSYPDGFECGMQNAKMGSLQLFMTNSGNCEDLGPGSFPVEEVHKISVFDMRMANADRHAGNILIGEGDDGQTVLIPIDHGYCLPEKVSSLFTFVCYLFLIDQLLPFDFDLVVYERV